ncbi:Rho GTPase-activating protein 18 [Bagarius yarrelli]|uniref:Rho GTPase-activating protein 18 n=1 Tax=Bagarius yarrelli TaxID=175774 RepID=A0A556TJS9_BAGYA|nr:Rho GTPase-activating protein 18 [Bagarius yarrelli]
MDLKESGSVVLTAYHSFTASRIRLVDERYDPPYTSAQSSANRKTQHRGLVRMTSAGAMPSSPPERSISQDSQDSMEDYWSEVRNIEEDCQAGHEEMMEKGSIDEAELEEAWLHEAGLSTLVSGALVDSPAEALLSTLTRSQAAMVKKRLDNYTQTLRKRNKQPIRHVRDVFSTADPSSAEPTPTVSPNGTITPILPHWTPPKGRQSCPVFTPVDSSMSECQSEPNILLVEVPYSEGVTANRKGRDCYDCQRIWKSDKDLPTFQIVKPKQGLTRVHDLSSEDLKKIGYISLIELTTFYDALGIELKRNRGVRSKVRETGIFGVPLTTLLENDQKKFPGSKVPLVFKKHLRQELEAKFYDDSFDWEQVRQNDAAGLLKMFIRELPYPLLTLQHLPAFTAAQNISSHKHQLQALHLLVLLLPEANRDTLKKAKQEEMQGAAGAAHLVRLLIVHQDLLWTVPCFLISHVRKMNEASTSKKTPSSEKTKRKLLRRRNTERDKERSEVTDLCEGVIRVQAPLHAKISMAIKLDSKTKARDVMARFDFENGGALPRPRHPAAGGAPGEPSL